jgi:hypothetical protein
MMMRVLLLLTHHQKCILVLSNCLEVLISWPPKKHQIQCCPAPNLFPGNLNRPGKRHFGRRPTVLERQSRWHPCRHRSWPVILSEHETRILDT